MPNIHIRTTVDLKEEGSTDGEIIRLVNDISEFEKELIKTGNMEKLESFQKDLQKDLEDLKEDIIESLGKKLSPDTATSEVVSSTISTDTATPEVSSSTISSDTATPEGSSTIPSIRPTIDSRRICQKMRKDIEKPGSDLNEVYRGNTQLARSILNHCPDVREQLINDGADINKPNPKDHRTPLMTAASQCDAPSGHSLINGRANISLTDPQGNTAYDIAAKKPCKESVVSVFSSTDGNDYSESLRQDAANNFFNEQETNSPYTEAPRFRRSTSHAWLTGIAAIGIGTTTIKSVISIIEDTSERHETQIVNQIANRISGIDTDFYNNIWWQAGAGVVTVALVGVIGTAAYCMRQSGSYQVRNHNNPSELPLTDVSNK